MILLTCLYILKVHVTENFAIEVEYLNTFVLTIKVLHIGIEQKSQSK